MRLRVLTLLLCSAMMSCAGPSSEFDHVVARIEQHYGVKRTHIPLMGFANFVVKVARPAGARGFKLAVFEDLRSSSEYGDTEELTRFMDAIGNSRLRPLVVTRSHKDGSSTYILCGDVGKTTKMLIAAFERNEATVVEVQVDMETLLRTIGTPSEARKFFGDRHGRDRHDW
jgi:hypothetical protein